MISLSVLEVAAIVGGRIADASWAPLPDDQQAGARVSLPAVPVVTGPVVTDSRQVSPGCLFVAIAGERVDGHDYAEAAVQQGAVAVLAQRPVGVPAIVVDDPQQALGRLARAVCDRLAVTVVGVTGSSGKTSTKDLLAQVLSRLGPVVAPPGSFNNELGLPLTVLRADDSTRVLVLEFGARGVGHIRTLTQIAPPTVSLVLNVGAAHAGEFGSPQITAAAKSELVQALPSQQQGGVAVLNADDPRVAAMQSLTQARVLRVGVLPPQEGPQQAQQRHLTVWAQEVQLDQMGRAGFTLGVQVGESDHVDTAPVSLQVYGRHQVSNAVAVAAAAWALGMPVSEIAQGLSQAGAVSRWRMEVTHRDDGLTVINDAYNANPESMRAALESTVAMSQGRGRWAILGPMRELGPRTHEEHILVGQQVASHAFTGLITVDADADAIAEGALEAGMPARAIHRVTDATQAVELARTLLQPNDVVVIKASRAVGLEAVAEGLTSPTAQPSRAPEGVDQP